MHAAPTPRKVLTTPNQLASDVVRKSWRGLSRTLRALASDTSQTPENVFSVEDVHQLRVACRRVQAGTLLATSLTGVRPPGAARRMARMLRQAAGPLRNADVHQHLLRWLRDADATGRQRDAIEAMLAQIVAERSIAKAALGGVLERVSPTMCRRIGTASAQAFLAEPRTSQDVSAPSLEDAAQRAISPLVARVARSATQDLREPEHAHALRLAIKPLRYALEQLQQGGRMTLASPQLLAHLAEAQRRLGESNDIASLLQRTMETPGAHDLRARFARVMNHRTAAFAAWWDDARVLDALRALVTEPTRNELILPIAAHAAERSPSPPTPFVEVHRMPGSPGSTSHPATRDPALATPAQAQLFLSGTRLGVIDIGSNSIRLLAVELIDERHWTVLSEERAMTRLAHGIDETDKISSEAMARSVEAITRFKAMCDRHKAACRAFATAAVRDASNKRDFLSLVKDRTGLDVEIISALDEGKLTYRSVARAHDLSHGLAGVVDIGGGSLEVVTSMDGVITSVTSMPLGAVRLTEHFGGSEAVAGPRFRELKEHCDETIAKEVRTGEAPPTIVVGCGGTFNTLLTLSAAARGVMIERGSPALRELGPVTREQLKQLIKHLRGLTLAERLRVPGLPSDRADIVIAGLCAVERLMRHLGVERIHGYPGGVREGLLLRWIDERRATTPQPVATISQILEEVRSFASKCRYEREHSEHVARLATSLFDQFRRESDMILRLGDEPGERTLLEAAAILHDIGVLVEYEGHHKHSARMIQLADFVCLTPRQRSLVALIARYHRRTLPKQRHREFHDLPMRDQQLVMRLAAILRVADGLDRTHTHAVQTADVRFSRDAIRVLITSTTDASEELRAAKVKADLLEDVLGVTVRIERIEAQADTDLPAN
jgi:exopolyphosphatase / guanosine-5'-triphosphate,3'-diphosphate pyrophosphatase